MIQELPLRYFSGSRSGYGIPLASSDWGAFKYFIEVEDQHVKRQVNRYSNGIVVRYDRSHWCDDFGFMFVGRLSRKQKAGRGSMPLTADEFEKVWAEALSSPTWSQQVARSREKKWGTWAERVGS